MPDNVNNNTIMDGLEFSDFEVCSKSDLESTVSDFVNIAGNLSHNTGDLLADYNVIEKEMSTLSEAFESLEPLGTQGRAQDDKDDKSTGDGSQIDSDEMPARSPDTTNTELQTIGTPAKPVGTLDDKKTGEAMYLPHAMAEPVSKEEKKTFEIGVVQMNGTSKIGNKTAKVYHQWSRFERFLSSIEVRTPLGTRYLLQKPDSLFQSSEQHSSGFAHNSGHSKLAVPNDVTDEQTDKLPLYSYQHYYEIRPSAKGGLGAFAVRDIEKDQLILLEKPFLRSTPFTILRDVHDLPKEAKQFFMTLAHDPNVDKWTLVDHIRQRNAFQIPSGNAIFAIASRFNHACHPVCNVTYAWDSEKELMSFVTTRHVSAGEELTITYGGRPIDLYVRYGFVCKCGGCESLTDDDINRYNNHMWGLPAYGR